jgi:hypothetical protein
MLDGMHPDFNPDDFDEVLVQDTDAFNSLSWLFSDRCGFRYFPTIKIIKRFGLLSYIQLFLNMTHYFSAQFLKCLVKSDKEGAEADAYEEQKGILACFLLGLLPSTYWVLHYVIKCSGWVDGVFVGYIFEVVYMMLGPRFLLVHLLVCKLPTIHPVFREYDFW